MPSASHSLPQPDRKPEMTCITTKFRSTPHDQAAYTVQAVASLLLIMDREIWTKATTPSAWTGSADNSTMPG